MAAPKSGLLDQILLEDIARYCPQQFLAFHTCMSKEVPDPDSCAKEQYGLAGCIKKTVPSFNKIQTVCAGKLQAYEACLRNNNSDTKKCESDLSELRDCAFGTLDTK
ncbi:uncharacterized protein RJT20DRAFT_125793 [Scheffersomyces xylosifermentans]|uniref:uncharacterized protein n=1 Tax=Scheffersomyces xylosifermentans TaxID=1304137 RepID=UPI00315DF181